MADAIRAAAVALESGNHAFRDKSLGRPRNRERAMTHMAHRIVSRQEPHCGTSHIVVTYHERHPVMGTVQIPVPARIAPVKP